MKAPAISPTIVFADDAWLAAALSSALSMPGEYLPVCDGPRMQRPDHRVETLRRHNAAARARAKRFFLAGIGAEGSAALSQSLQSISGIDIQTVGWNDVPRLAPDRPVLRWGRDRLGIGLLRALRAGARLEFGDHESPRDSEKSAGGHLVVCEESEDLSQVIAANYAFALAAGLHMIPAIDSGVANALLENFYSVQGRTDGVSPREAQAELVRDLLALCGSLPVPDGGSITFISKLPFGFAFPEYPCTHLFDYPDLGIAIIHGFAAEQRRGPSVGTAVLVDPDSTPAPDIEMATRLLEARGAFIRVYKGAAADVRNVSEALEHFPYDLFIVATHCGDSSGYRDTYRFIDSEGRSREIVVDLAVGFARTDDPERFKVGHFFRFVSVDGVDWSDEAAKATLYVGTAIHDFNKKLGGGYSAFKPETRKPIPRVVGSSAMKMADSNLLFAHHTIAGVGTPIVINNACLSWHRLAATMMFAGARAYVGTLFPVLSSEAADVATRLLDVHWGKPLPVALWLAQRDVYSAELRRPYVVAGVFPQALRVDAYDPPQQIASRLSRALQGYRDLLAGVSAEDDASRGQALREIVAYLEAEVAHFKAYATPESSER
jgi:hypothetical protein